MNNEIWTIVRWKNVKPNMYLISNFGRIKNFYTGKIIKPKLINSGYYVAMLITESKSPKYINILVHRLVAFHFIPNDNPYKDTINHKDQNKLNNISSNLEWMTQAENNRYTLSDKSFNRRKKLSDKTVHKICQLLSINLRYKDIIAQVNLPQNPSVLRTIDRIKKRLIYTEISQNYIFPAVSYSKRYTIEQINDICKMIEDNCPVDEIYYHIKKRPYRNSILDKEFYQYYLNIKHHNICNEISCAYDF